MLKMTQKEMKLNLALELNELNELSYELLEDIGKAEQEGNQKEIDRLKRHRSKTIARIRQTKKIAAILFHMHAVDLENMAFEISVQKATEQLKKA